MRLLEALSCFILMDASLLVHGKEENTCGPANTKVKCSNKLTTYIRELDSCLFHIPNGVASWIQTSDVFHELGLYLPMLDTQEKNKALYEYAKRNGLDDIWIGLIRSSDNKYRWSESYTELTQDSFNAFNGEEEKGRCGLAVVGKHSLEWELADCQNTNQMLGAWKTTLHPEPPIIAVDKDLEMLQRGTNLTITCNSILSVKGELKIALFSVDKRLRVYGYEDHRSTYDEHLVVDNDTLCKREAHLSIVLELENAMEGSKVACFNYITKEWPLCSKYDFYCRIAGTISFIGEEQAIAPATTWFLLLGLMIIVMFPLLLPFLAQPIKPPEGSDRNEKEPTASATQQSGSDGRETSAE